MSTPFAGETFTFRNPDGTTLDVRGWGNQYAAVFESLDGYTVTKDPDSGYFTYARRDDDSGRLEPLDARVGQADPAALGIEPHLRSTGDAARAERGLARAGAPEPRRWEIRRAQKKSRSRQQPKALAAPEPAATIVGHKVGLCVLVQFPDVPPTISRDAVDRFCNQPGYAEFGNNGSVRDYFFDVSDGKLTYTNTVVPYVTAAHNRAYYTNPAIAWTTRARELLTEALDHLVSTGFDFSALSADSGGFVLAVNLFYAGANVNNWAEGLWPGSTSLSVPYDVGGGHQLFDFQFTNMGSDLTIRTFCHENGHMICDFPDLYDYGNESNGAGNYCLMGFGGDDRNPVQVNAYLKREAGWASTVTPVSPGSSATIHSGQNDFFVHSKNSEEYFILENRQQTGRDLNLPDNGLVIWHVDEFGSNSNEQMSADLHYECSLEQADGRFDLEHKADYGDTDDLFAAPGTTRFAGSTVPDSRWWDGSASGLAIESISLSGPAMTFTTPDPVGWSAVGDDRPAWTDDLGWNQPQYHSTMRLAVARNDLYLLGRGSQGVDTWRFTTASSTWAKVGEDRPPWSDASSWDQAQYHSTMRLAVARNDLFLLARASRGIDTWRFDTTSATWAMVGDNTPGWSNAAGWNQEHYYATLRLAAARNDLFLLGRGAAGVDTWRFTTAANTWAQVGNNKPAWTDAAGWNQEHYYATLRLAVARNNLYLVGRGAAGVDTWRFDTAAATWTQVGNDQPAWTDAAGWKQERYYSTLRLVTARNDLFLLGRGAAGVDTWRFTTATNTWAQVGNNKPAWTDAAGWNQARYYSTLRAAVANDNVYLLGRGAAGVDTWRLDTAANTWAKVSDDTPAWSDADGWDQEHYNATLRLAPARDDLYLLGRGANGVDTWRFNTA